MYYGYRFYAPEIGRWLTRDPLGEAGGLNLYAFTGNNPVNWVDPWGLQAVSVGGDWIARGAAVVEVILAEIIRSSIKVSGSMVFGGVATIGFILFPSTAEAPELPPLMLPEQYNDATCSTSDFSPLFGPSFVRKQLESGREDLEQLEGISKKQKAYRQGKSDKRIDSIDKSKRRLKNTLKRIRNKEEGTEGFGYE